MCLLLKFNKFILVPTLTEWLESIDLLKLDISLLNYAFRDIYLQLLKEFFHLFQNVVYNNRTNINFLEVCGWYQKYGFINQSTATVTLSKYDRVKFEQYGWLSIGFKLAENIESVILNDKDVDNGNEMSLQLLFKMKQLKSVEILDFPAFACLEECSLLTSLTIDMWSKRESEALVRVIRACTLLSSITLTGNADYPHMLAIAIHCKNLKQLTCSYNCSDRITKKCCFILVLHMQAQLNEWKNDNSYRFYEEICKSFIFYRGKTLTKLLLCDLPDIPNVIDLFPNVRSVSIMSKLTLSVSQILEKLSNQLEEINVLRTNNESTDTSQTYYGYPCIRKLDLCDFTLNANDFMYILKCTPRLQSLTIECISRDISTSGVSFHAIILLCKNLTDLSLYLCQGNTNQNIALVAKHLKQITCLSIDSCGTCCDVMLFELLKLPQLIEFSLNTRILTVDSDTDFAEKGFICNVNFLTLCDVYLTDDLLLSIVGKCSYLKILDISRNTKLTSNGFISIAPYCKKLTKLFAAKCPLLDDVMGEAIIPSCKRLQYLSIGGCNFSNDIIKRIEEQCIAFIFCLK